MSKLIDEEKTHAIIGAAMEVHRELGSGFLEAVYQEALQLELGYRKIPHEFQKRLAIRYKNELIHKEYIVDLICFGSIIIELKVLSRLSGADQAQLLHYLKATGLNIGLLINFGSQSLEWKRLILK